MTPGVQLMAGLAPPLPALLPARAGGRRTAGCLHQGQRQLARNQGPEGSRSQAGVSPLPGLPAPASCWRAQPAKQAQPSPDARQTSQAFFPAPSPAGRGPHGTDPALLHQRFCWGRGSQRTPRPALNFTAAVGPRADEEQGGCPTPRHAPGRFARCRVAPARAPSAHLARSAERPITAMNSTRAAALQIHIRFPPRTGMRLGSYLKAICSWRRYERAAALGKTLLRWEILPLHRARHGTSAAGSLLGPAALQLPGTGRGRWVLHRTLPSSRTANDPRPHLPTNSPKNATAGLSLPKNRRYTLDWKISSLGTRLKHH